MVDDLIAAHGAYSPLALLLETGRLAQDDYDAWCRGEQGTLDAALTEGVEATRRLVEQLDQWARTRVDLTPAEFSLVGTGEIAGKELIASANAEFDALLRTEFRAAEHPCQDDIFLQAQGTPASRELTEALLTRDIAKVELLLSRLEKIDPPHSALENGRELMAALLADSPSNREEALARLRLLSHRWVPAANAVLRDHAFGFMQKFWLDVGNALSGWAFDTEHPTRHASWAYGRAGDWERAKQAIVQECDHTNQPILMARLAEAEWHLDHRDHALHHHFTLCWSDPGYFEEVIARPDFPNRALRETWFEARDDDLDPPISPPWFPAWTVIHTPQFVARLRPRHGPSDPECAYDLLLALQSPDGDTMDHRKALQAIHGGLFKRFLANLGT